MGGFRKNGSYRLHFRKPCEDAFEEGKIRGRPGGYFRDHYRQQSQ